MQLILRAGKWLSWAGTKLDIYSNWTSSGFVMILMFLISTDIITRFAADAPIPGSFEIGQMLMVFIVFLALAQTQAERAHIRVEIVLSRVPARFRTILEIVTCVAGLLLFSLIVWKGWAWAAESVRLREYALGIVNVPLYPSKIALVVGCIIFCLRFVHDIVRHARVLMKST